MVWPHFDSPETMKLSMITWAAFPKSPNCASHSTRLSGEAAEYPYSKPRQPASESGLLWSSKGASAPDRFWIGTYLRPVFSSQ